MIGDLLDAKMVRPKEDDTEENLCLDAGYVGKDEEVRKRGYVPHIRSRGEEKGLVARDSNYKPRRWVVECFHSWLNKFRHVAVRHSKTDRAYHAFLTLAAAIITLNKVKLIYG